MLYILFPFFLKVETRKTVKAQRDSYMECSSKHIKIMHEEVLNFFSQALDQSQEEIYTEKDYLVIDQNHTTGTFFKSKIKKVKLKENCEQIFEICQDMMDKLLEATNSENEALSSLLLECLARLIQNRNPIKQEYFFEYEVERLKWDYYSRLK